MIACSREFAICLIRFVGGTGGPAPIGRKRVSAYLDALASVTGHAARLYAQLDGAG